MKLAAFYSDSPYAGWCQTRGFGRVLRRMGHDVTEIAIPPVAKITRTEVERINKPIDDVEAIIVSGPEHLARWIKQFYPQWDKLKVPKIGWYHESFVREDYTLDFEQYKPWIDIHFFPDKGDAEKFQGHYLTLGVDTQMFKSLGSKRDVDVAFIGLMYPKRALFYQEVQKHLGTPIRVANGNISVTDLDGLNIERSTELLAEQYRRINIFVTFPSLSNVLVAKVLESMASGCVLVAPKQPIDLEHYLSYETPEECAKQIKAAKWAPMGQRAAAEARQHSMESRFTQLFEKAGLCKVEQSASPELVGSSATI